MQKSNDSESAHGIVVCVIVLGRRGGREGSCWVPWPEGRKSIMNSSKWFEEVDSTR